MAELTADQRRALMILAKAGDLGEPESFFVRDHGFGLDLLAGLVSAGYASASLQARYWPSDNKTTVAWMRITNAGRQALATRR